MKTESRRILTGKDRRKTGSVSQPKSIRDCTKTTWSIRAECFFEHKKKTQAMRASAKLFDAVIGKRGKRSIQVVKLQFLSEVGQIRQRNEENDRKNVSRKTEKRKRSNSRHKLLPMLKLETNCR